MGSSNPFPWEESKLAMPPPDGNSKGKKKKDKRSKKISTQPSPPKPSPEPEKTALPFSQTNPFYTLIRPYPPGYSQIYLSLSKDDLDTLIARHMHPTAPGFQNVPAQALVAPPPLQVQVKDADDARKWGSIS